MTEQLKLSPKQMDAVTALLYAVPAGLVYADHRVEARETLDSLVRLGAATAVDVEGGRGYQLSKEMMAAFAISSAKLTAREASLN